VIDIQTFMLALGVGNLAFALLMGGYLRNAASAPGLRTWMWARSMSGTVQVLSWLLPQSGPALTMDLAAFAWVGGAALEVAAYCQFFEFAASAWRKLLLPTAAVALVAVAVAMGLGATTLQMTRVMALAIAAFSAGAAGILLRPRTQASLLQRVIGVNDALFAVAILAWIIVTKGQPSEPHARPILGMAYLASYLLMIVNGFGFLLLCKQKDDAHMRRLATIDDLTDMLNRRAFFEHAERAREGALRLQRPVALMMLDLDHFKQLNDSYGHACGDDALRTFAGTARKLLREGDVLGRLGGEEFALVLPRSSLEGARLVAERLRMAVNDAVLPACAGDYRMTVSIGLVTIAPDEALTTALARADHALYAAKTAGRNRVQVGQALEAAPQPECAYA
jgi:diguanylate cyclase (GGDEF)-like protein